MGEARHFRFGVQIDTGTTSASMNGLCSGDLFKFCKISDNISEMVQKRDISAMQE